MHKSPSIFAGVTVVAKEGMMEGAWFLRDAKDRILSAGLVGMGKFDTPGADLSHGVRIECHPRLYDAFTRRAALEASHDQ